MRMGIPQVIISDQGREFSNALDSSLATCLGLHSTFPFLHYTFPFLYTMLLCYVPSASMITLLIYTRYITACKTSQRYLCPILDLAYIGDQYFQGRTKIPVTGVITAAWESDGRDSN